MRESDVTRHNEQPEPSGAPSADVARRTRAMLRGRILHALYHAWEPLADEEAANLLETMARRFDQGLPEIDADESSHRFYATLAADPDLADMFARLVESEAVGVVVPPPSPRFWERIGAIGKGPRMLVGVAGGRIVVEVASVWEELRWEIQKQTSQLSELVPATRDVREVTAGSSPLPAVRYRAIGEEGLELALVALPSDGEKWRLQVALVRLVGEGQHVTAGHPWTLTATLQGKPIPGGFRREGVWTPDVSLSQADLGALNFTVVIEPAGP